MTRLNSHDTLAFISALIYPHSVSDITPQAILDIFRPDNSNTSPRIEDAVSQVINESGIIEAALPKKRSSSSAA